MLAVNAQAYKSEQIVSSLSQSYDMRRALGHSSLTKAQFFIPKTDVRMK